MTTMPPATLASRAASLGEAPAASATVKVLMTVSPAPVTSAIWSRPVNGDERDRAIPLEERHAATAARHEEQPGVEALEHRPAGLVERALVVERHARQGLHLGLVRRGPGGPAEARQIVAAVHDDGQVPRAGQLEDELEDPGRHRAVAIVRNQEGLGPGALGLEALDEVSLGIRRETGLRLPVEPHHLLARGLISPGHDARLHRGRPIRDPDEPRRGHAHPAEQGVDLVAGAVSPEEADGDGLGAERVDIVGGIGGAARGAPRAL